MQSDFFLFWQVRGIRSADYYNLASVLFCDIYDFKTITSVLGAKELVSPERPCPCSIILV